MVFCVRGQVQGHCGPRSPPLSSSALHVAQGEERRVVIVKKS